LVSQQLQAEQEEEYITNRLMKRLETLKQEKEDLARQVEVEEEMITNKLTKKLEQVKQEKVHLENQLEQEQEYIVNKLQKQLSTVLDEKRALEARLSENTEAVLGTIHQHLQQWRRDRSSVDLPPMPALPAPGEAVLRRDSGDPASDGDGGEAAVQRSRLLVTHLTAQIDALGLQQETYHQQCQDHEARNEQLRAELQRLQGDNSVLAHRVAREREKLSDLTRDKARLETELELDSERAFNSSGGMLVSGSRCPSYPCSPALGALSPSALAPSLVVSPRLLNLPSATVPPFSPSADSRPRSAGESRADSSSRPHSASGGSKESSGAGTPRPAQTGS